MNITLNEIKKLQFMLAKYENIRGSLTVTANQTQSHGCRHLCVASCVGRCADGCTSQMSNSPWGRNSDG